VIQQITNALDIMAKDSPTEPTTIIALAWGVLVVGLFMLITRRRRSR
jgi:hypothetical protein